MQIGKEPSCFKSFAYSSSCSCFMMYRNNKEGAYLCPSLVPGKDMQSSVKGPQRDRERNRNKIKARVFLSFARNLICIFRYFFLLFTRTLKRHRKLRLGEIMNRSNNQPYNKAKWKRLGMHIYRSFFKTEHEMIKSSQIIITQNKKQMLIITCSEIWFIFRSIQVCAGQCVPVLCFIYICALAFMSVHKRE